MKNLLKKWLTAALTAAILVTNTAFAYTPIKLQILDVEVENQLFNPYEDQEAEITFVLNKGAYITLTIEDEDADEIDTVTESEWFAKGDWTVSWDGRDMYGDIVNEDKYTFVLDATDTQRSVEEEGDLIVKKFYTGADEDTIDPRIKNVFLTKESFDPGLKEKPQLIFDLSAEADVTISIYKNGKKVEEVTDQNDLDAGNYSIEIDAREFANTPGDYTYKIYARNSKGDDVHEGEFTINQDDKEKGKPNVFKDKVDNIPFNPSSEKLGISFKLDQEAELTIEIKENDYTVVKMAQDSEFQYGSYTVYWDGKDKFGDNVSDGIYEYKITAKNFKGKDVETGYFLVRGSSNAVNPFGTSCGFTDVDSYNQYCDAIKWASANKVFVGYNDGQFRPNQYITRAEALKVILETLNVRTVSADGGNYGFADLDRFAWYMSTFKTALSLGVVNGYGNGTMAPNKVVTKAEGLKMLLETGKVKDGVIVPVNNYANAYYDTDRNAWYSSYAWVAKSKALNSNEVYFYPEQSMTRAEMADMLYRYDQAGFGQ